MNRVLFTVLFVPLAFFVLRDTIAVLTELMFRSMGGEDSLLYQIDDDIARQIITGMRLLLPAPPENSIASREIFISFPFS